VAGDDDLEFCPHCGADISEAEAESRRCDQCGRAFDQPVQRLLRRHMREGDEDPSEHGKGWRL